MKILIVKSLLTSLYQREKMRPSFPHSGGFAEAKAKRGRGDFMISVNSILRLSIINSFYGLDKLVYGHGCKC